jgi:hypothetical protein
MACPSVTYVTLIWLSDAVDGAVMLADVVESTAAEHQLVSCR